MFQGTLVDTQSRIFLLVKMTFGAVVCDFLTEAAVFSVCSSPGIELSSTYRPLRTGYDCIILKLLFFEERLRRLLSVIVRPIGKLVCTFPLQWPSTKNLAIFPLRSQHRS